mmetsp:Transcript_26786/g.57558  ORF Transcript_26786/g.57558 Transcript_26786/m.57558 type:complete len:151 (-) Transcript_26786:1317-1769(-)
MANSHTKQLNSTSTGQKQSVPPTESPSVMNENGKDHQQQASPQNIAAMIESRSNPSDADAASHNFGQPIRPPHYNASSSTSAISNKDKKKIGASKLVTDCGIQQRASLACIEENYQNKDVACMAYFEEYKKCRREEHERKLEANAKASAW